MKKVIILISFLVACGISVSAQVRIVNSANNSAVTSSPAFIDASSNPTINSSSNIGKGLVFPRVDLSLMESFPAVLTGSPTAFPTRLDGMIVYNTKVGGVAGVGSTEGELTRGFWYYDNPSVTLTGGTWRPINSGKDAGWEVVGGNTVTHNHVQISNITRNGVFIPAGAQIVIADENGVMSTIDISALCGLCTPDCPVPATPGEITIYPSTIDVGGQFTAMVPNVPGLTYIWVLPNGLSGSSNTNSITVTGVNAGNYAAGLISVIAYNECGGSGVRMSTINVIVNEIDVCDPPATPGAMTITPNPVNVGSNITATVPNVPGIVYAWTYPSSLTLVGSPIGNSVTFTTTTATTYPAGSISVKAISAECGESAAASASLVAVEVQNIPTLPCGGAVNIGGAVWACSNVDAPGTFAATSSNFGMIYQFNRITGWSGTAATVSGWNSTADPATLWAAVNDPCPTGWRVPTGQELIDLTNQPNVQITAAQASALGLSPAAQGIIYGTSSVPTTFNPVAHLFLPTPTNGWRNWNGGGLSYGTYYWANNKIYVRLEWNAQWNVINPVPNSGSGNQGFSVRCVKQ